MLAGEVSEVWGWRLGTTELPCPPWAHFGCHLSEHISCGWLPITSKEKGWGWGRRAACSMGLELAVPGTCVGLFHRRSQQKNVTGRVGLVLLAAFALKARRERSCLLQPAPGSQAVGSGQRVRCARPLGAPRLPCSPTALPHTLFPIL